MASQSILLVIRRLWEYVTVSSQGDFAFTSEENDPVGEFLEQRSREAGLTDAETEMEVLPMKKLEPEVESSQATADMSAPAENLEVGAVTSQSESENEVLPPAAVNSPGEAEGGVLPETTADKTGQAENEAPPQVADNSSGEAENKAVKGAAEEDHKGAKDDMLDIFRSESEVQEKDPLQENLVDIDIQGLLEEGRDIIAEINARRYRRA